MLLKPVYDCRLYNPMQGCWAFEIAISDTATRHYRRLEFLFPGTNPRLDSWFQPPPFRASAPAAGIPWMFLLASTDETAPVRGLFVCAKMAGGTRTEAACIKDAIVHHNK